MVMENLIKCGVRVHGGNGNGTLISKTCKVSCWNTSLVSFYLQENLLSVDFYLMFNDGGKGWSWTERVVSSQYACSYF